MIRAGVVFLAALAMSSCAEVRVHRTFEKRKLGEVKEETYKTALLGFKTYSDPVDLSERCPKGWEDLVIRKKTMQSLVSVLTLNLYSPWTIETVCTPVTAPAPR